MGSIERRLERLEEQISPAHLSYEDWPLVEQIEDALCYVKLHAWSGSVAACTDQQLRCLGLLIASWENPSVWENPEKLEDLTPTDLDDFPEWVKKHVSRLGPRVQPERDAWLRKEAGYFVRFLEELPARMAEIEEQVRARTEESRRRDREFLQDQRARRDPLLPPLDTTIPD